MAQQIIFEDFLPLGLCPVAAEEWDGTTYYVDRREFGVSGWDETTIPSGSSEELTPVVGLGTEYPIGLTYDEFAELYWRSKRLHASVSMTLTATAAQIDVSGGNGPASVPEIALGLGTPEWDFTPDPDTGEARICTAPGMSSNQWGAPDLPIEDADDDADSAPPTASCSNSAAIRLGGTVTVDMETLRVADGRLWPLIRIAIFASASAEASYSYSNPPDGPSGSGSRGRYIRRAWNSFLSSYEDSEGNYDRPGGTGGDGEFVLRLHLGEWAVPLAGYEYLTEDGGDTDHEINAGSPPAADAAMTAPDILLECAEWFDAGGLWDPDTGEWVPPE